MVAAGFLLLGLRRCEMLSDLQLCLFYSLSESYASLPCALSLVVFVLSWFR